MRCSSQSQATTIDIPPLSVRADLRSINEEARSVELLFSTGAGVMRFDWMTGKRFIEVLSLKPEHVDLARLNSGAPLLDAHSAWSITDQIGVVEPGTARIEKGKALATVRFSKREQVEAIWGDVRDRILTAVSVGYRVHEFKESNAKDGEIPTRTATRWEPFEISLVPMPADIGAKVRAGDKTDTNLCVIRSADADDYDRVRRFKLAIARSRVA